MMKQNALNGILPLTFHQILVLTMLAALAQLFSPFTQAAEKNKLHPRQINLSGNIFHFALPEDFSRNMPAADMVETLDIDDLKKFDNPEYGNLIRRWWDVKEPGWFGKNLGMVMMDISVQRVVENKQQLIHKNPYDIKDPMDFIIMIYDSYVQKYDAINKEIGYGPDGLPPYYSNFASMSGRNISSLYHDHISNQQKWIRHSIISPTENLILNFSTPIASHIFLQVSFIYSHNTNVSPLHFRRGYAFKKMEAIENSFKMDYTKDNPFGKIVGEDWLEQTNDQVLEQHRANILKLFYGPDPEAALLEMERKNREFMERDEREIREALKNDPL